MSKRLPANERNPNRRGAFALRLHTGRVVRFKDAAHRAECVYEMSNRRFAHAGELTTFVASCPNGYSTFRDLSDDRS